VVAVDRLLRIQRVDFAGFAYTAPYEELALKAS
jgi:hypothetical protein